MISVQQVVAWWKRATPEEKFAFLEQIDAECASRGVDSSLYYVSTGEFQSDYLTPPNPATI